VVDQQQKCILREALNDLPTRYREVLLLRVMKDVSYQEIANTVGIPIGTVMSRLSRARKRLQRDLVCQEVPALDASESSLTSVPTHSCWLAVLE
jgi:RNA polymerase sigma-70 factor (ECF subfamily)